MSDLNIPFRKTVLAIMSAKGGVGKSTHTYNMGIYFHLTYKLNVLILDVEKKPALSELVYSGQRHDGVRFDIKHYFQPDDLADDLEMFKMRYDIILLDTAGVDVDINSGLDEAAQESMNESAISAADFVVIPTKPSALDARKTLKFCESVTKWMKASRGSLSAMCFLNEARMNENLSNTVHQQMKGGLPIPYREEFISYTPYIGESMLRGLSMFEFKPNHVVTKQLGLLAEDVLSASQKHLEAMGA